MALCTSLMKTPLLGNSLGPAQLTIPLRAFVQQIKTAVNLKTSKGIPARVTPSHRKRSHQGWPRHRFYGPNKNYGCSRVFPQSVSATQHIWYIAVPLFFDLNQSMKGQRSWKENRCTAASPIAPTPQRLLLLCNGASVDTLCTRSVLPVSAVYHIPNVRKTTHRPWSAVLMHRSSGGSLIHRIQQSWHMCSI